MNEHRWRGFLRYMEPDRGFGGWLVWFFISGVGAVVAQGYLLVQSGEHLGAWSASHLPHARSVLVLEVIRTFIRAGILGSLVIGLWLFANEDRRTPAFWTAYFAAVIPVDFALGAIGVSLFSRVAGESFGAAVRANAPGALWPIAFAVAWGLYWRRSGRVRNTYGYTGWRWPPPTGEPDY